MDAADSAQHDGIRAAGYGSVGASTNWTPQVFPFRHTTGQCWVVLKPSNDRSNLKATT